MATPNPTATPAPAAPAPVVAAPAPVAQPGEIVSVSEIAEPMDDYAAQTAHDAVLQAATAEPEAETPEAPAEPETEQPAATEGEQPEQPTAEVVPTPEAETAQPAEPTAKAPETPAAKADRLAQFRKDNKLDEDSVAQTLEDLAPKAEFAQFANQMMAEEPELQLAWLKGLEKRGKLNPNYKPRIAELEAQLKPAAAQAKAAEPAAPALPSEAEIQKQYSTLLANGDEAGALKLIADHTTAKVLAAVQPKLQTLEQKTQADEQRREQETRNAQASQVQQNAARELDECVTAYPGLVVKNAQGQYVCTDQEVANEIQLLSANSDRSIKMADVVRRALQITGKYKPPLKGGNPAPAKPKPALPTPLSKTAPVLKPVAKAKTTPAADGVLTVESEVVSHRG
jgi:hypothetical protein